MLKYAIALFAVISISLYVIYFYIGKPKVYGEEKRPAAVPHLYKNAEKKIGTINLIAVYFVPNNKKPEDESVWRTAITENLDKLARFHEMSFHGASRVHYSVYPKPVIGLKGNLEYDTTDTNHGNPQALRNISDEIEERLLNKRGDLYSEEITDYPADYRVVYVIYEGVGASGTEENGKNLALLNRVFLTKDEYKPIAATLLAHEFYHTLGLPDGYDIKSGAAFSRDIMGYSREYPIEAAFLSTDNLAEMGI